MQSITLPSIVEGGWVEVEGGKKRRCKLGVSKTTGRCLKNKRQSKRSACKFGVSKTTGRCLKNKRRSQRSMKKGSPKKSMSSPSSATMRMAYYGK